MARFHFQSVDAAGATRDGVIEAGDEAEVIARLRREGQLALRVTSDGGPGADVRRWIGRGWAGGLRRAEVAEVTRELATMLGAGQDLDRALRYLVETAVNRRVRASMAALREKVRDGGAFAAALVAQPESFPPFYLGMVRAGEAGGRLAEALEGLADSLEREQALRTTVQSALIYPTLLIIGAVAAVTLILTQVLPQFTPLFTAAGAELPDSTRLLIAAGDFVSDDGAFVLLGLLVLVMAGRIVLRGAKAALVVDRIMLATPVLGPVLREVLAARLTRTLGTLLANGVPLTAALRIVNDVLGNAVARRATLSALSSVEGGAGLASPLEAARAFPVRMVQLLRLGEENANLAQMALRAADIHEGRVRVMVQRLLSLLVPAITIVMGGVVALIVAALMTAMLSLNDLAG